MNNNKWLAPVLVGVGLIVLIGIGYSVQRYRQQKAAGDFLKSMGVSGNLAEEIAKNAANYNNSSGGDPYEALEEIGISDSSGKAADAIFRPILGNIFDRVKATTYFSQNALIGGMELEYTVKNNVAADVAAKSLADALTGAGFTIMSNASDAQEASIMVSKDKLIYNITYSQEQKKVTIVVIPSPN
jgi:hypothetical protein